MDDNRPPWSRVPMMPNGSPTNGQAPLSPFATPAPQGTTPGQPGRSGWGGRSWGGGNRSWGLSNPMRGIIRSTQATAAQGPGSPSFQPLGLPGNPNSAPASPMPQPGQPSQPSQPVTKDLNGSTGSPDGFTPLGTYMVDPTTQASGPLPAPSDYSQWGGGPALTGTMTTMPGPSSPAMPQDPGGPGGSTIALGRYMPSPFVSPGGQISTLTSMK
jgi:hypothetical protein